MKITLLSCSAQRPDKRAIVNCLTEIAILSTSLANDFTEMLLEGDQIEIEVEDRNTATAYRALRKLSIDYEIVE